MSVINNAAWRSFIYGFLVMWTSHISTALAMDVGRVKLDDLVRVMNDDLRLNGAGSLDGAGVFRRVNDSIVFGLYLRERKNNVADIIGAPGAKRLTLVMTEDMDSELMSRGFLRGVQNNVSREERLKITSQLLKFGELFATIGIFKKGEVFQIDWNPKHEITILSLNGKTLVELPDKAFYNAMLLCLLGEKPIGPELKKALIAGAQ